MFNVFALLQDDAL